MQRSVSTSWRWLGEYPSPLGRRRLPDRCARRRRCGVQTASSTKRQSPFASRMCSIVFTSTSRRAAERSGRNERPHPRDPHRALAGDAWAEPGRLAVPPPLSAEPLPQEARLIPGSTTRRYFACCHEAPGDELARTIRRSGLTRDVQCPSSRAAAHLRAPTAGTTSLVKPKPQAERAGMIMPWILSRSELSSWSTSLRRAAARTRSSSTSAG